MTRPERKAAELVRLAAAIDTLPMAERAAYLLGAVDGLDYGRIGFRLGLSVEQVERLTADALFAVSEALHADEREKPQE